MVANPPCGVETGMRKHPERKRVYVANPPCGVETEAHPPIGGDGEGVANPPCGVETRLVEGHHSSSPLSC